MESGDIMSDLARAELALLESEGFTPTWDEVIEINTLAHAIETPASRRLLARGIPVFVGGVTLWPMTMRGFEWFSEVSKEMDKKAQRMAVGYSLCFGRSEGDELNIYGRDAEKAVKKWYWSLRCTRAEYDEAVHQLQFQDIQPALPSDPNNKPMTPGSLSSFLSACCGGDVEMWERQCAMSYAYSVMQRYVVQNHADKKPCSCDPRILGEIRIGHYISNLKKRHLAARKAAEEKASREAKEPEAVHG